MSKIDWQTGTPLDEGMYLVTLSNGTVTTDVWLVYPCRWYDYDNDRLTIIAWCPLKDIQPYVEPKFKIGEIVVENGIIGTITAINKDGTYLVVGAALMPMTFTPSMCRLATPDEALSLGAKWREQGMYYDVKTNELKKL